MLRRAPHESKVPNVCYRGPIVLVCVEHANRTHFPTAAVQEAGCVSNHAPDVHICKKDSVLFHCVMTPRCLTPLQLVALMTGPLTQVQVQGRVPLSVICPVGCEEEATFALDLAAKGLQLFEDTFEISYPLPKLDLGAVPDFSAGAMENWGLILFRKIVCCSTQKTVRSKRCRRSQRISSTRLHTCGLETWLP